MKMHFDGKWRAAVLGLGSCILAAWCPLASLPAASAGQDPAATATRSGATEKRLSLQTREGKPSRVVLSGLSAQLRDQIRKLEAQQQLKLLTVEVMPDDRGEARRSTRPTMLGTVSLEDELLVFTPRYPFRPGLRYLATFHEARVPGAAVQGDATTVEFELPAESPGEESYVTQVFPSGQVLPENQLKFYLHFSAPMRRGNSYRHVHLFRESGEEVELPFLELGEELWDPEGQRFTLFFDPGRIKRGLKPREDVGPSIEAGQSYTLVIDRQWRDARGRPLRESYRKSFRVGPPDTTQPDPAEWTWDYPSTGSDSPLVIHFREPLDRAMLQRVLTVHRVSEGDDKASPTDSRVTGQVRVDRAETRWSFVPDQPWKPGRYKLVVDTALEDLAGNSIARPFEVDIFESVEREVVRKTLEREFTLSDSTTAQPSRKSPEDGTPAATPGERTPAAPLKNGKPGVRPSPRAEPERESTGRET